MTRNMMAQTLGFSSFEELVAASEMKSETVGVVRPISGKYQGKLVVWEDRRTIPDFVIAYDEEDIEELVRVRVLGKVEKGAERKYQVSGRAEEKALNGGIRMLIPWPEEELGQYGSNRATDRDVDEWVERNLVVPSTLRIASIYPGRQYRKGELIPCIQVTLVSSRDPFNLPLGEIRARKWI